MKRFIISFFLVLSLAAVATAADDQQPLGAIYWSDAADGDELMRVYPVDYHLRLTDSSDSVVRHAAVDGAGSFNSKTNYNSSPVSVAPFTHQGKTYSFQINSASLHYATGVFTAPITVAGFDHMTVQFFEANFAGSYSHGTTDLWPASDPYYGSYDKPYTIVGSATKAQLHVLGSCFPETDHLLNGKETSFRAAVLSDTVTAATAQSMFMMSQIPSMDWEGSRYSSASYAAPATYPITQLGVYHYGVRGLNKVMLFFEPLISSPVCDFPTPCVVIRLNRDVSRGRYP